MEGCRGEATGFLIKENGKASPYRRNEKKKLARLEGPEDNERFRNVLTSGEKLIYFYDRKIVVPQDVEEEDGIKKLAKGMMKVGMMKVLTEREMKTGMKIPKMKMKVKMEKLLIEVTEVTKVKRDRKMKSFSVKKKSGKKLFG